MIDEGRRKAFEAAWKEGEPDLAAFLPELGESYLDTLVELAAIDLELGIKAGLTRSATSYIERFPVLREHLAELEEEERRVRATPTAGMYVGRYKLEAVHARGGFGVVWRAADVPLGREIALKTLADDHPESRTRFLEEAKITARLEHPGIVPVHEVGLDGTPFYTMKLVRGRTLRALIEAGGDRVAERRLLDAFVALAHALGFAHARGVMHRDVKPENVLVGDFGETVLLDWGLARSLGQVDDEVGTVLGTPAYMAPEQLEGRVDLHDARTDVYALGLVLRECVPRMPKPLAAIARKATDPQRERRYTNASEVAHEVERWLADAPVLAHREGVGERVARSMRRHRTRWVALGVALVLGLVGLVFWQRQVLAAEADAREGAARDEALARGHLVGGRPEHALSVLDLAIARLDEHAAIAAPLVALQERAQRLHTFARAGEAAWFLAGEERDAAAIAAINEAVAAVDAQAPCAVFGSDLPPGMNDTCRRRAHRLMLLEVVLHAKQALVAPFSASATKGCQAAMVALTRARVVAPTAFGDLVQRLCATQTPDIPATTPQVSNAPNAATDAYFFGLANLWVGDMPPGVGAILGPILGDGSVDLEHPVDAAIDRMREAVRLEPDEYWHHFMLGNALTIAGDHRAAALAFGTCVAMRPDYPRGLEARGGALISEALEANRPERVALGVADYDAALALAPDDPWTHWSRGTMVWTLGKEVEAVQSYLRALELDPDGLRLLEPGAREVGLSTRVELTRAAELARRLLAADPDDTAALELKLATSLLRDDEDGADDAAARLQIKGPSARGRVLLDLRGRKKGSAESE